MDKSSSAQKLGRLRLRHLVLFSTLWIFLLGAALELTDQEAYYWSWATKPALSYYEHPPLQAWVMSLLRIPFGDSAAVIRLPAIVGRLVSLWAFWLWAKRRSGEKAAEMGLWMLLGSFFLAAGSLIALPDSYMFPLALLTMYFVEQRRSCLGGLCFGLAGLSKFPSVLLYPGIVYAFIGKKPRDVTGLIKTSLIALLMQAPVLLWNSRHNWASFAFHLHQRHNRVEPIRLGESLGHLFSFAGAQLVLGGIGYWIALYFAARWTSKSSSPRTSKDSVPLGWWIWPPFVIFGMSALRGEQRFYWTSIAFPAIAAAIGSRLAQLPPDKSRRLEKAQTTGVLASLALLSALVLLPVGAYLKPFTDLYKHYDLRHSPRGDLKGWREWVEEDLKPQRLLNDETALIASDFHLASQAAWAAGISDMSRVGTTGLQFQFEFWPRPRPPHFKKAIFFGDNRKPLGAKFAPYCESPVNWQTKQIRLNGELIKEIYWGLCENYLVRPEITPDWKL